MRGYVQLQHLGKILFFWKWIIKEHFPWWQHDTPLTNSKQEWKNASIYHLDYCTRIEPPFPELKQHFETQSSLPSNPNNQNMLTNQEDGQMIHVPQNHYIYKRIHNKRTQNWNTFQSNPLSMYPFCKSCGDDNRKYEREKHRPPNNAHCRHYRRHHSTSIHLSVH